MMQVSFEERWVSHVELDEFFQTQFEFMGDELQKLWKELFDTTPSRFIVVGGLFYVGSHGSFVVQLGPGCKVWR